MLNPSTTCANKLIREEEGREGSEYSRSGAIQLFLSMGCHITIYLH